MAGSMAAARPAWVGRVGGTLGRAPTDAGHERGAPAAVREGWSTSLTAMRAGASVTLTATCGGQRHSAPTRARVSDIDHSRPAPPPTAHVSPSTAPHSEQPRRPTASTQPAAFAEPPPSNLPRHPPLPRRCRTGLIVGQRRVTSASPSSTGKRQRPQCPQAGGATIVSSTSRHRSLASHHRPRHAAHQTRPNKPRPSPAQPHRPAQSGRPGPGPASTPWARCAPAPRRRAWPPRPPAPCPPPGWT